MTATALAAAGLVLDGKGILAAASSRPALDARLRAAGVWPGEASRRAFAELLVTTPGLSLGISGIILGDETFGQRLADGRSFPGAMADLGLRPGIRVDTGAQPLAGAPGETVTEGLDGLRSRLAAYAALGARFATWRAVLRSGDGRPSWRALRANACAAARYALVCQEAGVVPVVEVLTRGREATSAALMVMITELQDMGVALDGVVLEPGIALPDTSPEAVAQQTLAALWCVVPEEVAGVALLAAGQSPARATANLAAVRRLGTPWPVTFAFGRALTDPALAAWHGDPARVGAGQRALASRVAGNVAALQGSYTPVLEPSYVLAGCSWQPGSKSGLG